jgi:hypothetical protein
MSNQLSCGVEIQRGVTFAMKIEAETSGGTAFDFSDPQLTNSAILYASNGGDEVATLDLDLDGVNLIATLSAAVTAELDVGKLWLQVRSENEAGFVWQFLEGFVNVY